MARPQPPPQDGARPETTNLVGDRQQLPHILLGSFNSAVLNPWFAIIGASGVIFAAVYLLWMYQRVIFGNITNEANRGLRDMSGREIALMVPVLVFIVWIGVYPDTFLRLSAAKTKELVAMLAHPKSALPPASIAPGPQK